MHYHFFCECVLSSEVEVAYVLTARQIADIFTKPLGLNKLQNFLSELELHHLDMPTFRGRKEEEEEGHERSGIDRDVESDEEFDFGPTEEAEEENRGRNRKKEPKIAGQGGDTSKKGGKAKIKTCSDVVKGLETKDELAKANSGENNRESEMFDSNKRSIWT